MPTQHQFNCLIAEVFFNHLTRRHVTLTELVSGDKIDTFFLPIFCFKLYRSFCVYLLQMICFLTLSLCALPYHMPNKKSLDFEDSQRFYTYPLAAVCDWWILARIYVEKMKHI